MKKSILWLLIIMISASLVALLSFNGCKPKVAEETTAAETTVAETTAAETKAEETTAVAEEQELYAFCGGWWGIEVWQSWKLGAQLAEKYFNEHGVNMKIEFTGPEGDDIDAVLAGLQTAVVKNPIGIIWYPLSIGEKDIMNDYLAKGGLVPAPNGTISPDFKQSFVVGTDNLVFGKELGNWLIELAGDSLSVGIMTMTDIQTHIVRTNGVKEVFKDHPNIKIVEPLMEQTGTSEGAAANAASYIAANPDVDAYVCTSALGGAAVARALKEAGFAAGEKFVVTSDTDAELIQLIKEGYINGTLAQSFAVESFYMIAIMHFLHNNVTYITEDDAALGILPCPVNSITPLNRVTKDNVQYFEKMPKPLY